MTVSVARPPNSTGRRKRKKRKLSAFATGISRVLKVFSPGFKNVTVPYAKTFLR
ncbi:hypothetical protein L873DRAFT_1804754 [Choiromyces venosus 120613-1]|uniref:Uncharacterized protein n=1 Tax=Choiromyces venosus 120613-1 TaxID=1336337 RepID=A0A3N4JX18_9PEZI|nr:hypothetical protein L873DRAFT_1804754 [Choiromyces venosus 120613-1]